MSRRITCRASTAFEVWYLLHFCFFDGKLHRHLVQTKLGELLQQHSKRTSYRKNDPQLYELLLSCQEVALQHALKLERVHGVAPHGDMLPADANPCTLVHRLVRALNAEIH